MVRYALPLLSVFLCPISWAAEFGHQYYEVNGARLYAETSGAGSPIVFLHGGLMFFDNSFGKQRELFARRHKVVGIDQRGHGHSPDGPWRLSYRQMADDTAMLLEQMHIGPVDIVGHSDGGNVALLVALYHPTLVRRVVISGANLRGLSREAFEAQNDLPRADYQEKIKTVAARLPPYFSANYSVVSPDGAGHWMEMVEKCFNLWSQPIVIESADLKKISAPVLVIAGDHDFTSIAETNEIFQGLPRGQLMVVPGSGHGTFETRPDLVNLAIAEFLDSPD